MLERVVEMIAYTARDPKAGAMRAVGLPLDQTVLWGALLLISVLSVLMTRAAQFIAPDLFRAPSQFPDAPFFLALTLAGGLLLMVFCIHYVGRMFGGQGAFEASLRIVILLQVILLALQVVQMIVLAVSPALAVFLGYVIMVFSIWLLLNFIAVVHGFNSLVAVFGGMIAALVGISIGLSLLVVLIALILGVDISNA